MKKVIYIFLIVTLAAGVGCSTKKEEKATETPPQRKRTTPPSFSKDFLKDKVFGMLLGSAIGDAMGAPTEMWPRSVIQTEYGYVSTLTPMVRAPSPEGTWQYNLPEGGTTDDTRWKVLLAEYLILQSPGKSLQAQDFANFIVERYKNDIDALKTTEGFEPEPFEAGMRKIAWLQEWALVAKAYASEDITAYTNALNRFYGGEMVCAGLLFSPVIGAYYPGNPEAAYEESFRLDIFDLGFAKDVSALTSSMVAASIPPNATPDSILNVMRDIDPQAYFKSRLVGRMAHNLLRQAQAIVQEAKQATIEEVFAGENSPMIPANSPHDSLYHAQLEKAYSLLAQRNQTMPFHAAEIHLVNLTALLFSDFEFRKAMEFVVNYGRDNDTTAAVTGAVLGAYYGANRLPQKMVDDVIKTNRTLGIDLEKLANQLVETILS